MSNEPEFRDTKPARNRLARIALASGDLFLRYPEDGELRARTVVSRSQCRSTGKYPSWKTGRSIQWESPHERAVARLLDADPEVALFREQPLTICYTNHGESRRHYPDFLVEWRNGYRELWEVKSASDAARPEIVERTLYLTDVLPQAGFAYRMIVAEEIRTGPHLANAETLLKYGRVPVAVDDRERIRQILLSAPFVTWGAAKEGILGPRGRANLARLTLEGVLKFDRNARISDGTQFTLRS